ncbi:dihydroxy-acid dehydratase [Shigella flexneri]
MVVLRRYLWPLDFGHVSPEAASGGNIAIIEDGDMIAIDIPNRGIQLQLSDAELPHVVKRRKPWRRGVDAGNRERQVSFALSRPLACNQRRQRRRT